MIPFQRERSDFLISALPEKTFYMDFDRKTISGTASGLTAATQAARLILETERYNYIIYSYRYGTEIMDLIGRPADYACSELKRRITEALKQDDRIESVSDFSFKSIKGAVHFSFTVSTIYGELSMEKEIGL